MSDIIRPVQAPDQEGNYPYYNPMRALIDSSVYSGFVEINANLGEMYSQGAEIDVNYQVARFLFSLGYSYTNGEDKESNSKIPKVSQQKLNTNITYNGEKLFASFTARYYGGIWTAPSNSLYAGTEEIPGAFVLYANVGYKINKSLTFNLSADNVLNAKHWGSAPYGESIWIQPRAPQSLLKVFGGVTFKF
jgi:outer membrane receptor protein involved in Fe transport